MPIDLRDSRRQQVDAGNAIDWEHPDNRGLVYLMGGYAGTQTAGGFVNNLVNPVPVLASLKNGAKWVPAMPGVQGIVSNASSACAELTAPASLKFSMPITLACSFQSNGTAPTANSVMFGVTYGNSDGTPYMSYMIGAGTTGSVVFYYTNSGGLTFTETSVAMSSLTRPARIVAVLQSTAAYLYCNNSLIYSVVSSRTGPSYSANGLFGIGGVSYLPRTVNGTVWGGRIQNFAADAGWVARDYQRHLSPTTDDRLRWFSSRSYSVSGGGGTNRRRRVITGGGC